MNPLLKFFDGTNQMPTVSDVVELLRTTPFVLKDEKSVQSAIGTVLNSHGIRHKREVRLSEKDIVDFMVEGGIAIEVKMSGAQKRSIFRQCERYCEHASVSAIILMTAKTMGLPAEINGKSAYYVSFGRGWL